MLLQQPQIPGKKHADLHIHTDIFTENGREYWHGGEPNEVALAIIGSGLDVAAITEHNSRHNLSAPHWQDVQAEIADSQLLRIVEEITGTRLNIQVLAGTELPLEYNGLRWHVGHVFEKPFDPKDLPPRDLVLDMDGLVQFITAHPGITSLNHAFVTLPRTFRYNARRSKIGRSVEELIASGHFHAMEVLNAEMMQKEHPETYKTDAAISVGKSLKSRLLKNGRRLALTGSSDAHDPVIIGACSTEFPAHLDIFTAVRKGETKPVNLIQD